jgi:hypothetical protein
MNPQKNTVKMKKKSYPSILLPQLTNPLMLLPPILLALLAAVYYLDPLLDTGTAAQTGRDGELADAAERGRELGLLDLVPFGFEFEESLNHVRIVLKHIENVDRTTVHAEQSVLQVEPGLAFFVDYGVNARVRKYPSLGFRDRKPGILARRC